MASQFLLKMFFIPLYIGLTLSAGAQATSPRSTINQSNLPPELGGPMPQGVQMPQSSTPLIGSSGSNGLSNHAIYEQSVLPFSDQVPVSDVLDEIKEMLGLLMLQSDLQKLLDFEEENYAGDLAQKLVHREAALKSAIQGRISACK
jgi:hypothetical protein